MGYNDYMTTVDPMNLMILLLCSDLLFLGLWKHILVHLWLLYSGTSAFYQAIVLCVDSRVLPGHSLNGHLSHDWTTAAVPASAADAAPADGDAEAAEHHLQGWGQ